MAASRRGDAADNENQEPTGDEMGYDGRGGYGSIMEDDDDAMQCNVCPCPHGIERRGSLEELTHEPLQKSPESERYSKLECR